MKNTKTEKILSLFLIICPILDVASFLFRKQFDTSISISTFLRPIIPIIVAIYIFFKDKNKFKIFIVGLIYFIYACVHLYLFNSVKTGSAFSGIVHEAQYVINYTYMVLNLFIYTYVFYKKDDELIKRNILISISTYIGLIFLSIITSTSTTTYLEGMGLKGWFETGNSLSAILTLSLYILLPLITSKKYKIYVLGLLLLMGIYLVFLIGTRVGLIGFILSLFVYEVANIFTIIIRKSKNSKKILIGMTIGVVIVAAIVVKFGSSTLERRKFLQNEAAKNIDNTTGQVAHITVDLLKVKEQLERNELPENYLSEAQSKALMSLYNYANEKEIVSTDRRMQELVYNIFLIKYQANPMLILFGNGHLSNYGELTLEMEALAILFNFGIIGFILYLLPFVSIFIYGIYIAVKNIKKIDVYYIMFLAGSFMSFVLSILSGAVFFNSSSMMMIIAINVLLINKIIKVKKIDNENTEKSDNTKKKVIFGITSLSIGGAERILVDLCNELCDKYDITIFTIYGKGEFEKELSPNIKLVNLIKYRYKDLNSITKKLIPVKLLLLKDSIYYDYIENKYNVEIAFLEGMITNIFSSKNPKVKKIAFIHTDISQIFGSGIKSRIKNSINKNVYLKYDKIVFGSKDSLEKFKETYNIHTSKLVIHNYINKENVKNKADEIIKEKFDGNVNFLSVTRLVQAKALDRLIKVHSKLIRNGVNHKIYVLGDGTLKEELDKLITELNVKDTFILLGKRDNPYPYIKMCDYMCLMSQFEGYGMVVEEAKILDKFVVITDTAARESVEKYNKSMIVSNDEDGIYDGIKKLIINKDEYLKQSETINYDNKYIIENVKKLIEGEI